MEKVNDQIYYQRSKKNIKLTLGFLIGSILLFFFFYQTGILPTLLFPISLFFLLIVTVMTGNGIINVIKSYQKKEENAPYRPLIIVGNLVILGFFVCILVILCLNALYG